MNALKSLLVLIIAVEYAIVQTSRLDRAMLTIQEINSQFSSETNVFFDFDNGLVSENLSVFGIPGLVITSQVKFQFIYALDKDILAVVCISSSSFLTVQTSLNYVLHRMHHVNILFIILDSTEPFAIFDWAWMNGYKNSIAVYCTEEESTLYGFQPFPKLTLIKIQHISESSLQKPLTNFYQQPIRTLMANDPPRSFRYVNRQGKLVYSGLFLKLFVLFIAQYNATIQEVTLPPPYPNNFLAPDMIKALKEGKIDISPHPFLQLYDEYLCTYAFNLAYFYLMVPFARPVEQFMYFVLPFDGWIWIGIAVTVLLFAVGIFFGSRAVQGQFEFGRALLLSVSGILNIPFSFRTYKSKILLLIFILLSVVGIMLSNMYLAQLSTFLTTRAYEKQINTIEEAVASKLPISIAKYDKEVYAKLGTSQEVLDKVEIISLEAWHHQRRILNTSRMDIISNEKYSFFTYQQRYLQTPRVKRIDTPLVALAPAFALPFTSAYVDLYSDFFQKTIEAGIYNKFTDDLNDDGIVTGIIAFLEPEAADSIPLSLHHFKLSLFLLGGGFALAAMCFGVEIICFKYKLV